MKLVSMKSGVEYDSLSKEAKKLFIWRAGVRKKIKRAYNKRVRRAMQKDTFDITEDHGVETGSTDG
jgi:hypothetical protein